jgi:hypothetical protein
MQVATIIPSLTALLEHPEFQQGLEAAHEEFLGDYEPTSLTENEMIDIVETNLSRRITERDRVISRIDGASYSYLYNLGYTFGIINEGLTYTSTPR